MAAGLVLVTSGESFNYWTIIAFALMYPTIAFGVGGLVQTRSRSQRAPLRGRMFAIGGLAIAGCFLLVAIDFLIEFSQW